MPSIGQVVGFPYLFVGIQNIHSRHLIFRYFSLHFSHSVKTASAATVDEAQFWVCLYLLIVLNAV